MRLHIIGTTDDCNLVINMCTHSVVVHYDCGQNNFPGFKSTVLQVIGVLVPAYMFT